MLLLISFSACKTSQVATQPQQTGNSATTESIYEKAQEPTPNDAGMWLLPQIRGAVHAEMAAKGLKMPADEIYSTNSPSLNQSIVRVNIGEGGGGTGSFVSDKGLILTNHHVGYDATASASSNENNYLKNGFYAKTMEQEIPAEGYYLYIPIEQKEVTDQLASMVPDTLTGQARSQREQQARSQLIQQRKNGDNDLVVEIDDYWAGNRQFMSVYRVIRDVRLVYAPPSSVGKYGGDIDNWMWPRHTGDYTFLRAYVAPDGEGRPYNKKNVPYQPSNPLTINANGLDTGDFTMVLGFPGSTYRHQSSYAFNFYENYRNEYIIESLQAYNDAIEAAIKHHPEREVDLASTQASIANALKYYKGVQEGFKNYNITEKRRKQEEGFKKWIEQDTNRALRYRKALPELEKAFDIASKSGPMLYTTLYPLNYNELLDIASQYQPFYNYLQNPDSVSFSQEDKASILEKHRSRLDSVDVQAQNLMLSEMIHNMATLPKNQQVPYIYAKFGDASGDTLNAMIDDYMAKLQKNSIVYHPDKAEQLLDTPPEDSAKVTKDEMVKLFDAIRTSFVNARQNYFRHVPYMRPARELYVEGMLKMRDDSTEYADANFTLRMSGGRVMGYSPHDGIYNLPFTTFKGMIAKNTDQKPFNAPQALVDYYADVEAGTKDYGKYGDNGQLIVNFLSTNDITGGNSGSPVLNGNGEVVGLAFDGNIESVVGDYYFDPELKRTISVDIRYILFLMDKYDHTNRLLNELNIINNQGGTEREAAE